MEYGNTIDAVTKLFHLIQSVAKCVLLAVRLPFHGALGGRGGSGPDRTVQRQATEEPPNLCPLRAR